MNQNKYRIDGLDWIVPQGSIMTLQVQPLCPKHHLRMTPLAYGTTAAYRSTYLSCADCSESHKLPRGFDDEKQYVLDKIDSKVFKGMKVLNIDNEAIPLVEKKVSSEDGKYFVTTILTESKVGLRLVIYAGEKGRKEKTQIFVEEAIKRLAFDQNDLHPTDVFTKVEAVFADNTKASINK